MRNITQFKTTVLQAIFVSITLFGVSSCNEPPKTEDTKKVAEEHNEGKFNDSKDEKDAQFLVNAAEINLEEVSLGKLAQKSMMSSVKDLGKMMEEGHSKSMTELIALAKKKSITIPTSATDDAKQAYEKLSKKSETDFDKDYCDMMVKGHEKAIAAFEKASTESGDADIRAWATETLPNLRTHLDHSIACQKKCEKM